MIKPELIVCGSIAIDRIMTFDGKYRDLIQPDKLHTFSISMLLEKIELSRGGTGANIAYNLARLGEVPVLVGSVGEDGKDYIDDLAKQGVNIENVHVSKLSTASFNVINDAEDNQVGGFYAGAMADSQTLNLDKWAGKQVIVTVSAHDPIGMRKQVYQCKEFGLRLFYDVSQQVSNVPSEHLTAGINAAEIIIVNDYEMSLLSKKSGLAPGEIKQKVPVVVTTQGANGSIIQGKKIKSAINIGVAKPKVVLDPTGAGDAYRAGFLYGYSRGWELVKCGQLGATVASYVVEEYGSQLHYNKKEIKERYKNNFGEEIDILNGL
ncbi:carbohydrate kinase family protein [Candidatus Parcubacteria bacterium]|nr:carbohydrate kinase family protein [Candidatus Parcubacteria bacterium]